MIPIAQPALGDEELRNVQDVITSGWISSKGEYIDAFEEQFASYCNANYGITTSNGTTALHLALAALGISKGDEVIVPALTFVATANVVSYCNAKPIFVDSNRDYWCIDPEKIEDAITPQTKAIIPVHLYGHPCDMNRIIDIAEDNGLFVIEDVAEAHAAEYRHRKVGSFGHINCFSFYGNKIMTTGEGGMCLTDDIELSEKMRTLRDHGMSKSRRYWHEYIGFNYRMTNLQAAIGLAQLKKLDSFVEKRIAIAKWYNESLSPMIESGAITPHPDMAWGKCVYWMYSILINAKYGINRDALIGRLSADGIETRPFFYPIHHLPPYQAYSSDGLSVATELSHRGLNLPSYTSMERSDVETVAHSIIRHSLTEQ